VARHQSQHCSGGNLPVSVCLGQLRKRMSISLQMTISACVERNMLCSAPSVRLQHRRSCTTPLQPATQDACFCVRFWQRHQ
jgi:GH24 family phage-related lysozyme (muramidase)